LEKDFNIYWVKKFSILEAQSRFYSGGNSFSNGHRSKNYGGFLEDRHVLLDLDFIIYDDKSVLALVEKKFKAESKLGNILKDNTYQKKLFTNLCSRLGCKFIVHITSQNQFYDLTSGQAVKIEDPKHRFDPNAYVCESDDVVYIEFRNNQPVAIVKRTDGTKINHLLNLFASKLNIQIIGVNDLENAIKFYQFVNNVTKFVGQVSNVKDRSELTDQEIDQVEAEWASVYRKIGLY